jgi:RecB family exonuclease
MTLHLLVSPAASGKTHQCLDRVRQVKASNPLAPAWVLVPDRLQAKAIRRRLAEGGGVFAVHVGTFGDLYTMVLRRSGGAVPVASDPIIYRLVQGAVARLLEAGQLTHFAAIASTPGFIQTIVDRIAEFKRSRLFPGALLGATQDHSPGQAEIGRVYAAYQRLLEAAGWTDPEGLNWLAVEALEQDDTSLVNIRLVVVDGFDSFDASQMAAIRVLGAAVPEVIVTLPGHPASPRPIHRRFARALETLRSALPEAVLDEPLSGTRLPAPLAHLEANLLESAGERLPAERNVAFLEARTPVDEAREALRWIKARIVRDGLLPDECALVTPFPERYRPHLREAASEFGLPIRFTQGESSVAAPGMAALLDLLDLPSRNWPQGLTLATIRSPYFDLERFGLTRQHADPLQLASLAGPVVEGVDQWQDTLNRLEQVDAPPPAEDEDRPAQPRLPIGIEARSLWESLRAFADRLTPPSPQPIHAWVRWLEDLLDDLGFFDRQETQADQASIVSFRDTLRSLVLGEQVFGEQPSSFEAFIADLHSNLEGAYLPDPLPWAQPAIQVLRVLEARGIRLRAVALMGLSEGLFPEVEREDTFLREAVRTELGLEPRLGREQPGLFYQGVTRADDFLLLTRPTLADDGERWEPSPYWTAATSLFAESPRLVRPDDPRPLADGASPSEVLFLAVRRGSLPRAYEEFSPRFADARRAHTVFAARLAYEPSGPFEGDLSAAEPLLAVRYGSAHVWSPSRLETYASCPLEFLAANVLQLEVIEPPTPGMDVQQRGSLLHAILERAYGEAPDPVDPASVLDTLHAVAAQAFADAPRAYAFRPSPLWEMEQAFLLERLEETVRELAEVEPGWTPVGFERSFGREDLPALELEVDGETVLLRGVIDRVDTNNAGQLRVIDYKTGASALAPRDLIDGRRLQLPLYALAAERALGLGEAADGFYWAILRAAPGTLRLARFHQEVEGQQLAGVEGAVLVVQIHVARILHGIRAGQFPPIPPQGGCPSYCPAAGWCWRYAPSAW